MEFEHPGGIDREKPEVLFAALQAILTHTKDLIFVKDVNGIYVASTESFANITGNSAENVLGRVDADIFPSALAARYVQDDRKLLEKGENLLEYIEPLPDVDGEARYGSTSKYILTDEKGSQIGILGWTKDVTQRIKVNEHYQQELKFLFALPEDVYSAVLIDIDDWRLVSQRSHETHGIKLPEFETLEQFVEFANVGISRNSEAYKLFGNFTQESLRDIYNSGQTTFTVEYQRFIESGEVHWVSDEVTFMLDPDKGHLCLGISIKNIDDRMRADEKLLRAATTDQLTSLLNRAETERSIREFLAGDGAEKLHALFMIDVDNFKSFNDTLGHEQGDKLLMNIAKGIKSCFRDSDIVGRMGGDEFFVLMKNVKLRSAINDRANQLLTTLPEIRCDGSAVQATVSIGISIFSEDGGNFQELYRSADKALYAAKNKGKNQAVFCSEIKE